MARCPLCNGHGTLIGKLGNRRHWRCRQCGMDFSRVQRRRVKHEKESQERPRKEN